MRDPFAELRDHDAYELLGVTPGATDTEIKRAYKNKMRVVHPDANPSPEAEELSRLIIAAYGALTRDRAAYDAFRRPAPDPVEIVDPDDPWHDARPTAGDSWRAARSGVVDDPDDPWNVTDSGSAAPPRFYPPGQTYWQQPYSSGYVYPQPYRRRRLAGLRRYWFPLLVAGLASLLLIVPAISNLLDLVGGKSEKADVAVPKEFAGTWNGVVRSGDTRHAIRLTVGEGKQVGRYSYPLSRCGGPLIPKQLKGDQLTLSGRIAKRGTGCTNDDEMRLERAGRGKLSLVFGNEKKSVKLSREPSNRPLQLTSAYKDTWSGNTTSGGKVRLDLAKGASADRPAKAVRDGCTGSVVPLAIKGGRATLLANCERRITPGTESGTYELTLTTEKTMTFIFRSDKGKDVRGTLRRG